MTDVPMYGSERITVNGRPAIVVRVPCPQEPYGAQFEDDAGSPIKAWGKTPLEAIAILGEEDE